MEAVCCKPLPLTREIDRHFITTEMLHDTLPCELCINFAWQNDNHSKDSQLSANTSLKLNSKNFHRLAWKTSHQCSTLVKQNGLSEGKCYKSGCMLWNLWLCAMWALRSSGDEALWRQMAQENTARQPWIVFVSASAIAVHKGLAAARALYVTVWSTAESWWSLPLQDKLSRIRTHAWS